MKYELARLDNFIEANFNPEHLLTEISDEADLKAKMVFIRDEKNRIRFDLMNEVIRFNNDFKSQFHIQQHQKALIFLSNRIFSYQKIFLEQIGDYLLSNFVILFNEVNRCIEFLLEFIEKHFAQYFDKETIVSNIQFLFI